MHDVTRRGVVGGSTQPTGLSYVLDGRADSNHEAGPALIPPPANEETMSNWRRIGVAVCCVAGAGLWAFTGLAGVSAAAPAPAAGATPLIIDTDAFSDADDAGALAVANVLQDQGAVRLLGVMVDTPSRWGAPAVQAINTYYHHENVPVGALQPVDDSTAPKNWAEPVAKDFPNTLQDGANAPEAVGLYRKLLAAQPDHSVVIAAIGLETGLANLLGSPADATSPLTGRQLVAAKVKELVMMGGQFPKGAESNFTNDPAAAVQAAGDWPTPVVFDGYEIGAPILTGSALTDAPAADPVREAYQIFAGAGNDTGSWDLTAALVAGTGTGKLFTLSGPGHITVAPDGSNTWASTPTGNQHYLVAAAPAGTVADRLQSLLTQNPTAATDSRS
jgi:hypothetical protein